MGKHKPIRLVPSMAPNSPNFDVKDSDFFKKWSQLPSPEEVRAQVKAQVLAGVTVDSRKDFSPISPRARPPPALFEHMGLLVKWGSAVRLSEAQSLYAVGQLLRGEVPVPQVYGWRLDGEETFIYMEVIDGQTLERVWDTLESEECISICSELRTIYDNLRRLEQDPSDPFVGPSPGHLILLHQTVCYLTYPFHLGSVARGHPYDDTRGPWNESRNRV